MKLKRLFNICIFVIWMIVIFMFSNQLADISTKTSKGLTEEKALRFVNAATYSDIDDSTIDKIIDNTFVIVRKFGHFFEYMILELMTVNALKDYTIFNKKIFLFSLVFCFIYACSDEFHQLYVTGRTGQFMDIGIDMIGVLIGVLVFYIYGLLVKDRRLSKKDNCQIVCVDTKK